MALCWNRENPWESTKFAGVAFVVILALCYMMESGKANLPSWPKTVAIASLFAVFTAYVLPWLILRLPNSIVILSAKGVNNNVIGRGSRITFWPWSDIVFFSTSVETCDDRPVETITLHGQDGQSLANFGLSGKPTLDEVSQFLQGFGKPLRNDEIC